MGGSVPRNTLTANPKFRDPTPPPNSGLNVCVFYQKTPIQDSIARAHGGGVHECSGCPFFWLGKGPEKDRKGTTTKLVAQKSFLAVKFPFHKYQMSHVPFSTKWRHHGGKSLSAPHIFYV